MLLLGLCLGYSLGQTLQQVEGIVEIRSSPDDAWRPARVGDILEARGEIRTLQGSTTFQSSEYTLRLNQHSQIFRGLTAYELISGQVYLEAEAVKFFMGGPIKIKGQARLDRDPSNGQRLAILSGEATATLGANIYHLEKTQQLTVSNQGNITVSTYFERDPWYLTLVALAQGRAAVIGMTGEAELESSEGWKTASLDDILEPGYSARTGKDSWLELRFEDGSLLRLQSATEITLSQAETFSNASRRTLITLVKGKIWAVVQEGQPFEIETPGLVAGVRGTKFRVDAAQQGTDALLKTFEGTVAGIVGFEVFEVESGLQFEPNRGLTKLKTDALDDFNLLRDKTISAPKLKLDVPIITEQESIILQGQTDPGSIVESDGLRLIVPESTFSLERSLKTGFNVIEVRAQLTEGGKQAIFIQPVIRNSPEFIFALRAPQVNNNQVVVSGYATPGSVLSVLDMEDQQSLQVSGYFQLTLPYAPTITIEAISPTGQRKVETLFPKS